MRIDVHPAALLEARFALSPLAELLGTLIDSQRLRESGGSPAPGFEEWLDISSLHSDLISLLAHTSWLPDFVGQTPPVHRDGDLFEELARIASWDEGTFLSSLGDSLEQAWVQVGTGWLATHGLPGRTAAALRDAWDLIIAPDWDRRHAILRREIAHRTSLLARHGWSRAVADMGRQVAWDGTGALTVSLGSAQALPVGTHLRFVPTTHSRGIWTCDGPDGVALVYAARGTRRSESVPRGSLADLLGSGRAAMLLALDMPATPSHLHHQLAYALGTVGGHLKVLHESGLVERTRIRHEVYYSRTALGDALLRV